jgi:hypothetical protein
MSSDSGSEPPAIADPCSRPGGSKLNVDRSAPRYTEDIAEDIKPVVTEHVIHRDWCPCCQKHVEPKIGDPGSQIGNRVLVLSAWFHYGLGITISQIVAIFNVHLRFKLTAGGLVQMWHRLAILLYCWYQEIQAEALGSAVLHADETGWRVNGKTYLSTGQMPPLPARITTDA